MPYESARSFEVSLSQQYGTVDSRLIQHEVFRASQIDLGAMYIHVRCYRDTCTYLTSLLLYYMYVPRNKKCNVVINAYQALPSLFMYPVSGLVSNHASALQSPSV